jgi:hypothetical protein
LRRAQPKRRWIVAAGSIVEIERAGLGMVRVLQKRWQLRPNLRRALAAAKTSESRPQISHNILILKRYFFVRIGCANRHRHLALLKILLAGTGRLVYFACDPVQRRHFVGSFEHLTWFEPDVIL